MVLGSSGYRKPFRPSKIHNICKMPGKFIENYNHVPETKEDRQSLYSVIVFVLLI